MIPSRCQEMSMRHDHPRPVRNRTCLAPNATSQDRDSTTRQQRELDRMTGTLSAKTVAVPLRNLVPLLIDAANSQRSWLDDFSGDTIRLDSDLYEVLLAYQQLRNQEPSPRAAA
ncbi:MAG: hypothetical protein AAGA03_04725 [Planctomycetota bacterium]